jgi:uncharacterized membrane protein
MDFLNQILASLFAKFKAKNPTIATSILGALVAIAAFLQSQYAIDLFGDSVLTWLKYINVALLALVGVPTSKFVDQKTEKK